MEALFAKPFTNLMLDEDGFGTLELVLLICVLIALALLFKNTIVNFVSGVLDTISNQGGAFNPASMAG